MENWNLIRVFYYIQNMETRVYICVGVCVCVNCWLWVCVLVSVSSVESQKGAINIQRCSLENQKGAIAVHSTEYLNLNSYSTLPALNWRYNLFVRVYDYIFSAYMYACRGVASSRQTTELGWPALLLATPAPLFACHVAMSRCNHVHIVLIRIFIRSK